MERIGVVTDSIACLPPELVEKYHIAVISAANIYHEGKLYRDSVDLSLTDVTRILEKFSRRIFHSASQPRSVSGNVQKAGQRI